MYRVFGYDGLCVEFSLTTDSFVEAVRCIRRRHMSDVVFATGISESVKRKFFVS